MLEARAAHDPCLLCGEAHPLRVHGLPKRKVRLEEEKNSDVVVVVIYCSTARRRGTQYTLRVLPPFLLPRSPISLEAVLEYLSRHSECERIDFDEASELLGSLDVRTLRKHIENGWRMVAELRAVGALSASARPQEEAALQPTALLRTVYERGAWLWGPPEGRTASKSACPEQASHDTS
jgi:hypothetical protein